MKSCQPGRSGNWVARVVVAVLFAAGVVVGPGSATAQDRGFVMVGADAAYVNFNAVTPAADDCYVSVGLVRARAVRYSDGELVRPHSDLQVVFAECGALTGAEGVVDTVNDPDASIRRLRSASVSGIEVPITVLDTAAFPEKLSAIVTLDWTATGRRFTQVFRNQHGGSFHRTRTADVSGELAFYVNGVPEPEVVPKPEPWFVYTTTDHMVKVGAPEFTPQITRYSEVYRP